MFKSSIEGQKNKGLQFTTPAYGLRPQFGQKNSKTSDNNQRRVSANMVG